MKTKLSKTSIPHTIQVAREWWTTTRDRAWSKCIPVDYIVVHDGRVVGTAEALDRPGSWQTGSYAVPVAGGRIHVRATIDGLATGQPAWLEMRGSISVAPDLRA